MSLTGTVVQPDGTAAFREFLTLPAVAAAANGIGHEVLARELALRGITPDGVVLYGGRRLPVFDSARVPDLRAALGLATVPNV